MIPDHSHSAAGSSPGSRRKRHAYWYDKMTLRGGVGSTSSSSSSASGSGGSRSATHSVSKAMIKGRLGGAASSEGCSCNSAYDALYRELQLSFIFRGLDAAEPDALLRFASGNRTPSRTLEEALWESFSRT